MSLFNTYQVGIAQGAYNTGMLLSDAEDVLVSSRALFGAKVKKWRVEQIQGKGYLDHWLQLRSFYAKNRPVVELIGPGAAALKHAGAQITYADAKQMIDKWTAEQKKQSRRTLSEADIFRWLDFRNHTYEMFAAGGFKESDPFPFLYDFWYETLRVAKSLEASGANNPSVWSVLYESVVETIKERGDWIWDKGTGFLDILKKLFFVIAIGFGALVGLEFVKLIAD